jgi:hypothetical protein
VPNWIGVHQHLGRRADNVTDLRAQVDEQIVKLHDNAEPLADDSQAVSMAGSCVSRTSESATSTPMLT